MHGGLCVGLSMEWNGEKYVRAVDAAVRRDVQASAIELVGDIRTLISTPSRTVKVTGKYTKGKFKGQDKKTLGVRGSSRSKPGEPPHKDFGTLRSSIAHEMAAGDSPEAVVGSALKVARWMELGRAGGKRIVPKGGKKFLSWLNPDGSRSFARAVTQGAILPRPFLRRQLKTNEPKIMARIAQAIASVKV